MKHCFYYNYTALVLKCLINLYKFGFLYFFEKIGEGLSLIIYLISYVWVSVVYDCMTHTHTLTHLRYLPLSDHNMVFVKYNESINTHLDLKTIPTLQTIDEFLNCGVIVSCQLAVPVR